MKANKTKVIPRLLWVFPIILLLLTIHQANVALDLRHTLIEGSPATAEVVDFFSTDRVDISYDYVSLRVQLEDGTVLEKDELSIPHSFVPEIEGKEEIAVRVLPGADQEIVIESIGRAHWRVAAINSLMSLIGFLFSGVAIFIWNRFLDKRGDPSTFNPDDIEKKEVIEHSTDL